VDAKAIQQRIVAILTARRAGDTATENSLVRRSSGTTS